MAATNIGKRSLFKLFVMAAGVIQASPASNANPLLTIRRKVNAPSFRQTYCHIEPLAQLAPRLAGPFRSNWNPMGGCHVMAPMGDHRLQKVYWAFMSGSAGLRHFSTN